MLNHPMIPLLAYGSVNWRTCLQQVPTDTLRLKQQPRVQVTRALRRDSCVDWVLNERQVASLKARISDFESELVTCSWYESALTLVQKLWRRRSRS